MKDFGTVGSEALPVTTTDLDSLFSPFKNVLGNHKMDPASHAGYVFALMEQSP